MLFTVNVTLTENFAETGLLKEITSEPRLFWILLTKEQIKHIQILRTVKSRLEKAAKEHT